MGKILFLLCIVGVCHSVEFEKFFKVCNRNDPDLNECMVKAVSEGIATMADGIEEMDIPPIDPYYQKELKVDYNANQIVAKMHLKNIYVSGVKQATVHAARVRIDDDIFKMELDMSVPIVTGIAEYEGEGQYNALKIRAYGDLNTTLIDTKFTWKIEGMPEKNGDEIFVRINSFYMRPDIASMKTYLTNNNPETRELSNLGVTFANQNWKLLYQEFLPFAQANWNKTGTKIANKIFLSVPYNRIFPTET